MLGKRNLYLIGPMGTGKTAVGKHLGRVLGLPFIDSDAEIVRTAGVDIPYIFDEEGEEGFRRREHQVIAELCARESIVMATGGGAILDPDNRRILKQTGVVIFLQTSIQQQLQRVGNGRGGIDVGGESRCRTGQRDAARHERPQKRGVGVHSRIP